MANYIIAVEVILAISAIIEVKCQSTAQVCENGDSSNSIEAELSLEAIHQFNLQLQSIRDILTESQQERKSQQDRSLEAVDRRSQKKFESIHQFLNESLMESKNQQDTLMTSIQIQSKPIQELINTSFQQMISHHDIIIARLEAVDRRSLEQDISIRKVQSSIEFLNVSLQHLKNQLNSAVTSLQADDRRSQNQIETIHQFILNVSLMEMKNQQDTLMTSLQEDDRRSQEQNIYIKQIQSSNELLNVSLEQMKNQLDTAATSLRADDRRSQNQIESIRQFLNLSFQQMRGQQDTVLRKLEAIEHDHYVIKNQTQKNYWNLEIVHVSDLGEVPIPSSVVNNWIVLMHRFDGSLDFSRNWTEYKNGFGDMRRGEFWIGNEKIHRLTNRFAYTLRIEMYINGTWFYAEYSNFFIDSESNKYTLRLSGYSGNAGDSLTNTSLTSDGYLNGMSFSTWDVDNDRYEDNCAVSSGGGWWFNRCQLACLTCSYNSDFRWYTLRHLESSGYGILRAARMMIKSK